MLDKQLKRRCMLTALVLLGLRLFHLIPVPGVDTGHLAGMMEKNSLLGFLDHVSGNGLSGMSIMALSIGPYITASIVMQLLGEVFPKLKDLQKGKPEERRYFGRMTLGVSAGISLAEGGVLALSFMKQRVFLSNIWAVPGILLWSVGSMALAVIGKRMTEDKEHFIGNGISLILLVNILASYPGDIMEYINMVMLGPGNRAMPATLSIAGVTLLFGFTVYIHCVEKKIPVVYTGKVAAGRSSVSTLPVRLCPGGVVPVIFASGLLSFAVLGLQLAGKEGTFAAGLLNAANWFHTGMQEYTLGVALYIVLIFLFSFYYSGMAFSPRETAETLKKNGGLIPNVRPGKPTERYLRKEMRKMIAAGAAALTVIAVIPIALSGVFGVSRLSFFGISVLITVSVIMETKKDIAMQMRAGEYMAKARKGGLFYGEKALSASR